MILKNLICKNIICKRIAYPWCVVTPHIWWIDWTPYIFDTRLTCNYIGSDHVTATHSRCEYVYFLLKEKTTSHKWCWVLDCFNKLKDVIYTAGFITDVCKWFLRHRVNILSFERIQFYTWREFVSNPLTWKFIQLIVSMLMRCGRETSLSEILASTVRLKM